MPEKSEHVAPRTPPDTPSSLLTSKILPWLIIGFGITLRTAQYLANRSLWFDESLLVVNLLQRPFAHLLDSLDYGQVAPVAFLMVEKLAIVSLGDSEYVLRLFPFLTGIAALPLFYAVARSCLPPQAMLIGLTLFACSGPLIYFSSEVKQYSSDVTITLFLCLLAWRCIDRRTFPRWDILLLGISGAVAIWFSHPAIFILAGIGGGLAWLQLSRKCWRALGVVVLMGMFWLVSFVTVYFVCYIKAYNTGLTGYWEGSFMPFPPHSLADVKWVWSAFTRIMADPIGLSSTTMAVTAFAVGCATLFSANKVKSFILLSPLCFALLASGLHRYPFSGRLMLFIVPAMLICVAAGIYQVLMYTGNFSLIVKSVVIVSLVLPFLQGSLYQLFSKPVLREEITSVLGYMRRHWLEGDSLYVHHGAIPAFLYYRQRYGFAHTPPIEGAPSRNEWEDYLRDLETLRGRPRVWVLFSHIYRGGGAAEKVAILNDLDQLGTQLDSVKAHGAEEYLYNQGERSPVEALRK
jgi:hypothetical protein